MLACQHGLVALIDHLDALDHDAVIGALGVVALVFDGDPDVNRIADEDGLDEAQTVVAVGESQRINGTGRHADADAEDQRAMGDALPEVLRLTPLCIHVMGIKIAGLPRMEHNIGLRNRAPQRLTRVAQGIVLEVAFLDHSSVPPDWQSIDSVGAKQ
jgi:hypothetical protein